MNIRILILVLLLYSCGHNENIYSLEQLYDIELSSMDGMDFPLKQLENDSATVIIFLSPECPIAQKYTRTLNQFQAEFKSYNFSFYGIFNGDLGNKSSALNFTKKYKINFTLLKDEKNSLKEMLGATISPEVFVIQNKKIVYKGMIDNWFFALGKKRQIITEHFLKDALKAIVSGEEIKVKKTKAVGCYLQ